MTFCLYYITIIFNTLLSISFADLDEKACSPCVWTNCSPSIKGVSDKQFNPAIDAQRLFNAIEGLGTDEKTLITILTTRSEAQRREIWWKYWGMGRSLIKDIVHDTSFDFKRLLKALATQLEVFYTKELHKAVAKRDVLKMVEIFFTVSPCTIRSMNMVYPVMYYRYLSYDINYALKDYYNRIDYINLLLLMARGKREENTEPNLEKAQVDAVLLQVAMKETDWTLKKFVFMKIFTERSIPQLLETFKMYEDTTGSLIEKDIKNTFESSVKEIYVFAITIVKDTPLYFAWALNKTLSKVRLSVKDVSEIIRIVRSRCDIDLEDIKKAYIQIFKHTLVQKIFSKFSFYLHFSKALVATVKDDPKILKYLRIL